MVDQTSPNLTSDKHVNFIQDVRIRHFKFKFAYMDFARNGRMRIAHADAEILTLAIWQQKVYALTACILSSSMSLWL